MKKISSKTSLSISVAISYITLFVSIILAIYYTPYVLEALGDVEYGIRAFATSLVGYLAFLSFGMAPSYLRFVNIVKKEYGEDGEKRINGLFLVFYLVVAGAALIIGGILIVLIVTGVIPLENYTAPQQTLIIVIMAITVLGTMLEFPGIFAKLVLTYQKRFIWLNGVSLLITILSPVLSILVLWLGGRSIAITWVALGISVFTVALNLGYTFFYLKTKVTFKFTAQDKHLFKQIISFSAIVFVISTLSQMGSITDKVVVGFILGAEAVTLFQISTIFSTYLNSITTAVTGVFAPRLTEDAVNGRMDDVQYVHDFVIKVVTILMCLVVFGFASTGKEFIQAWIGVEKVEVFYFSLAIMASNLLLASQSFSFYIQRALNKNLIPALLYTVAFIINVGLCIGMTYWLGLWGCIIATAITFLFQALSISVYNSKVIKLKQRTVWLSLLLNAVIAAIPTALTYLLFHFVSLNELTYLQQTLIRGSVFVILFVALEFALNRRFVMEFLHTFLTRKPFALDKENPLQVLIPTMHNDTEKDIRALLDFLHVESSALVANQGDVDNAYSFEYHGHTINVINTKTRGVSVNRNILLNNLKASIGLYTDDDCELMPGYEKTAIDFFVRNRIEAAYFNGLIQGQRKISHKRTCFVISFNDVSHAGGPGIAVSKAAIAKYHLSFNEKLGTPNKVYNGEDSYFMFELVHKHVKLYRSSKVVFNITEGDEASSYFKGYDKQYFTSRGAVNKLVHPHTYKLFKFYYSYRLKGKTGQRPKYIRTLMSQGEKYVKKGKIVL